MKAFILTIILTGFMAITAIAQADITLTVNVPAQQVTRVANMVIGTINCGGLGTKACLERELKKDIKKRVIAYEGSLIIRDANTQIDALVDPVLN